ncbi:MAG: hypothetical protein KJ621_14655, partial [Proteobacteria bacterium]|nr:hypothetical protein [Pseudomonadota bacterium]
PETLRTRETYVRCYWTGLHGMDIRELTFGELEDLADALLKRLAPKTVWNILSDLRACLRWAKRRGDIPAVPDFPLIKFDRPATKWIDETTQASIIKAIPIDDRPIFIFLATYGRRPGEARALMWDAVDLGTEDDHYQPHIQRPDSKRGHQGPHRHRATDAARN